MEHLPYALMPAAGHIKTVEQVRSIVKVPYLSHIVIGSFTVEPKVGNTGGTAFDVLPDGTSSNSLGLPNKGLPYLNDYLREMVHVVQVADKKIVVSIAGESPEEYTKLVRAIVETRAGIIEVNLGCPNVYSEEGKQKAIAS